jgi:hypothetical protein
MDPTVDACFGVHYGMTEALRGAGGDRGAPNVRAALRDRRIARRPGRWVDPRVSEERRVVTTADNEAEAELICSRLAEAGIHAVQRAIGALNRERRAAATST